MTTTDGPTTAERGVARSIPARDRATNAVTRLVVGALRSPVVVLAGVVSVSAVVRAAIAVPRPSPWILPDEVVYSELAKSVAAGGFPAVRGSPEIGWGVVYPVVLAPAWALFDDPVRAYHAALAINALTMSLAAVPAYFLARMFVSRRLAYVVAAMTVLVPSMTYTEVLMTENACYPAFLLAVLLIARATRHPSIGNQALALLGLGVVALTRIQAMALVGAYLVAVVVYALTGRRDQRMPYLRRFLPTVVLAVSLSLAPMLVSIAEGRGPLGWLGVRSGTFSDLRIHEVPQWFVFLVADLVLYVAVAPAAATAAVAALGCGRNASPHVRLFAAVAVPTFVATLLSVSFVSASLDVDGTENLNERYVFYVVPLAFVGLALWIREGLPRPHPWAAVIVGACCLLPALLPIGRLGYNAAFQSLALLPWLRIEETDAMVGIFVTAFTLAIGALWIVCRERVGYLWLIAACWMGLVGMIAAISHGNSASNSATAFAGRHADWIERAIPHDARVAVVWKQGSPGRALPVEFWIMVTEFFNPSVGDVYRIGRPTYYETFLPTVPVDARPDGSLTDEEGRRIDAPYALVTCRTPVVGKVIARAPRGWLELVEVAPPLRIGQGGCGGPA